VPLFKALTHYANPALEEFQRSTPVTVAATDCYVHVFVGPRTRFTACDRAKDFLTKAGLSFTTLPAAAGADVTTTIGGTAIAGWDSTRYRAALVAAGYPSAADPSRINYVMVELILVVMVMYVTMVYGPIAAFLVELFPANIRYTSMSFPYHIGNGWFGGMLPLLATALVASSGDVYRGLWYPVGVAILTAIVGGLFLPETRERSIHQLD